MENYPGCHHKNDIIQISFSIDMESNELIYSTKRPNCEKEITRIPFIEVKSEKELIGLRMKKEPILIIRNNGKLFYLKANKMKLFLVNFTGRPMHKCDSCRNCYPGRCNKVKDRFFEALYRTGISNYHNTIMESKRIEKYPFIIDGIEFYGLNEKDYFICNKCAFYVMDKKGLPIPDFGIV